jgi:ATP-binding cassette subfamily C (CFTR/MRP) protein 4
MKTSMNLHNNMFNAITRATMYFFNTNSSGKYIKNYNIFLAMY